MKERSKLHDPGKFEILLSLNYRTLHLQKYLPLEKVVTIFHADIWICRCALCEMISKYLLLSVKASRRVVQGSVPKELYYKTPQRHPPYPQMYCINSGGKFCCLNSSFRSSSETLCSSSHPSLASQMYFVRMMDWGQGKQKRLEGLKEYVTETISLRRTGGVLAPSTLETTERHL